MATPYRVATVSKCRKIISAWMVGCIAFWIEDAPKKAFLRFVFFSARFNFRVVFHLLCPKSTILESSQRELLDLLLFSRARRSCHSAQQCRHFITHDLTLTTWEDEERA